MERFEVKFGTPEPIGFREFDEKYPEIDLDLEVRAAGTVTVTDIDALLYGGTEEAASKIREIALSSLSECIKNWPQGVSFWKNTTKAEVEKYIDGRFAERGITARTVLGSFALTSESRELYDAAVADAVRSGMFVDIIREYKNIIDSNEGQPPAPSSDDRMSGIDWTSGVMQIGIMPDGSRIGASTDRFCRFCGANRMANAKFCTECGSRFG